MKDRILLLTKDAMCKRYLPAYGDCYWKGKTPNLDELQKKGTVFQHFYTAAPSTVMAFRSMMTGKFAHETPYHDYIPMEIPETENDFFQVAAKLGYENHLLWDERWEHMVLRYGNCFGQRVKIHNVHGLNQPVGVHSKRTEKRQNNDELLKKTIQTLENTVADVCESTSSKIFMWIHLPHVLKGRTCYGGDIDGFDQCLGMLRKYFLDENIFVSSDHGNMDGYQGKLGYGFDVNTSAIEIPLITPKLDGLEYCQDYVSNVDMKKIIFERAIPKREFIYSDCAYYAQPHRKLAIIHAPYVYIYNKANKKEELYDLRYDEHQRCNLIKEMHYDIDRKLNTKIRDVYFYPDWDDLESAKAILREKKSEVWKQAPLMYEIRGRILAMAKQVYLFMKKFIILPIKRKLKKI